MTAAKLYSWKAGRTAAARKYIDVYAVPQPDGSLKLDRSRMGADVEESYGRYDLSSWFIIPAAEMPNAMTAVLAHSFSQRKRLDWHSLIRCPEEAGIEVDMEVW